MTPERLWFGDSLPSVAGRTLLWPAAQLFGALTAGRRALYDAGVLTVHAPAVPCVSIGNLTVGGTGKTPFAAWLAGRLSAKVRTAIVLRGYGGDEAAVHRRLNAKTSVIENPDRVAGVRTAAGQGARVVVLDDAFQHRRIGRDEDVVLVSAEQLMRPSRLLPAGPWREPLYLLRRATLIVVTVKSGRADNRPALDRIAAIAPEVPAVSVRFVPGKLVRVGGTEVKDTTELRDATVLAIAAIGEPAAFARQVNELGAAVTLRAFRDHHAFSAADVAALVSSAPADALCVCTLKDAVKLERLWPASRALWYLSQQLVVEHGAEHLDRLCARMIERANSAAAGQAGASH